jgi:hypothetical protein
MNLPCGGIALGRVQLRGDIILRLSHRVRVRSMHIIVLAVESKDVMTKGVMLTRRFSV